MSNKIIAVAIIALIVAFVLTGYPVDALANIGVVKV
jgi:hypothetical protein